MKNKMLRRRRKIVISTKAAALFGAAVVIFSYNLSLKIALPDKLIYVSSVLSMPDGARQEIEEIKQKAIDFLSLGASEKNEKTPNENRTDEEEDLGNTDDLCVTPDDIKKSMSAAEADFESGKYDEDGEVVEQTIVDSQATDSYKGVYLRNVTADSEISLEKILLSPFTLPIDDYSDATVLIYHTHSTESYITRDNGKFSSAYPARNSDKSMNMVRIGDEITRILKARGIGVIHDRKIYDTTYTGAYAKSREGALENLEKYPSIVITLDIHRDAVYYDDYTRMKPVVETDGKKAAQMMIITGAEGGSAENFPDWETNLAFAVNLQKAVNDKYENLMKPIYFCNRKYNMDITPYSLLIEIGTDVNTLEEAAYSGRLLGDALAQMIKASVRESEK